MQNEGCEVARSPSPRLLIPSPDSLRPLLPLPFRNRQKTRSLRRYLPLVDVLSIKSADVQASYEKVTIFSSMDRSSGRIINNALWNQPIAG